MRMHISYILPLPAMAIRCLSLLSVGKHAILETYEEEWRHAAYGGIAATQRGRPTTPHLGIHSQRDVENWRTAWDKSQGTLARQAGGCKSLPQCAIPRETRRQKIKAANCWRRLKNLVARRFSNSLQTLENRLSSRYLVSIMTYLLTLSKVCSAIQGGGGGCTL